ncbi:MAG TPA: tRNA pseudouridine(38-40) synthase TruA [Blastocatellia bacterium]|nr:tRNA pseudouridine(38-40) synthase TruA [Blastocatellia bacterium]
MPTWKLTIEYDGTRYHGWQEQKNAKTVAGEIRSAAQQFFNGPVDLGGAGRTDAGVHALAQVAHLRNRRRCDPIELLRRINDSLPPDINLLKAEEVESRFDARRDATTRYYLYQISTRRTAFAKKFVWWIKDILDMEAMQTAANGLIGMHDFARFADKRAEDGSTLVKVESVELVRQGDLIMFRIGASHFLWKMVRRVVGMLVEVGRGRINPDQFAALFREHSGQAARSGNLAQAGRNQELTLNVAAFTAPPSGLFLERVCYHKDESPGPIRSVQMSA